VQVPRPPLTGPTALDGMVHCAAQFVARTVTRSSVVVVKPFIPVQEWSAEIRIFLFRPFFEETYYLVDATGILPVQLCSVGSLPDPII
jgi:hypothetical protein